VQGDAIREIWGGWNATPLGGAGSASFGSAYGAFFGSGSRTVRGGNVLGYSATANASFAASRVVPTGPENSPVTIAVRYWRRVA